VPIPASRIRALNNRPLNPSGDFVVYWMVATRRTRYNFGLQRAIEIAIQCARPLVILEALRCDYPWANDRLHQFILEGMADNTMDAARSGALYYPYVEPSRGRGRGLLRSMSSTACAVVTDWYPTFFLPDMLAAAAKQSEVALEAVDSNGLIPLSAARKYYPAARFYRAFMQRTLREHLRDFPIERPLTLLKGLPKLKNVPARIGRRWPAASARLLRGGSTALASLPIDHSVEIVEQRGGQRAAATRLKQFLSRDLARYADDHNHPDLDATSRLSPYLHFGHISAHEVFARLMSHERWTTRKLGARGGGAREGWWGVSPAAEAFLDQLVVWRELSFNGCEYLTDYNSYASLPDWARRTLEAHSSDRRPHRYSTRQVERAETGDEVWNATQRQLLTEGWFHGYLRMLWGKKILEWSKSPADALKRMESLMNRYSLDGRDPNSYAGYAWVLGRYDRPWPERPIFGTVRSMTSASAKRKLKMKRFLAEYGNR
jgi:deoxyribodipyrimidine photo-lyase